MSGMVRLVTSKLGVRRRVEMEWKRAERKGENEEPLLIM